MSTTTLPFVLPGSIILCIVVAEHVQPEIRTIISSNSASGLEYCNSGLVGLPANLTHHLHSAQSAAARLIIRIRRYDHITDTLTSYECLSESSSKSPF